MLIIHFLISEVDDIIGVFLHIYASNFRPLSYNVPIERKQVRSDNDASEVGILGHFGTFGTTWDILGHFGTIRKTFRRVWTF